MAAASIAEISVEDCRDITDERLARLRHCKNIGVKPHHAVPVEGSKMLCLLRHGMADLAETMPQIREVEREIAHQPFDHMRTQMIVLRQLNSLDDGKTALARQTLIFPGRRHVLHITLRQPADRRCAKPDQRIGRIGGITLKIPPQLSVLGRPAQAIGRLGEMIDANRM